MRVRTGGAEHDDRGAPSGHGGAEVRGDRRPRPLALPERRPVLAVRTGRRPPRHGAVRVLEQGRVLLPRHRQRRPELQPGRSDHPESTSSTPAGRAAGSTTVRQQHATTASHTLPSFPDPNDTWSRQRTRSTWASAPGWRDVYERHPAVPVRRRVGLPRRATTGSSPRWTRTTCCGRPSASETNAAAFSTKASVVPGYIAKPVNAGPDQRRQGVDVEDHAVLDEVRATRPAPGDRRGPVQDHRAARARHAQARDRHRRRGRLVLRRRGRVHEGRGLQRVRRLQVRRPPGREPVPAAARPARRSRCRWVAVTASRRSASAALRVGSTPGQAVQLARRSCPAVT